MIVRDEFHVSRFVSGTIQSKSLLSGARDGYLFHSFIQSRLATNFKVFSLVDLYIFQKSSSSRKPSNEMVERVG